jgi:hypothetical protein
LSLEKEKKVHQSRIKSKLIGACRVQRYRYSCSKLTNNLFLKKTSRKKLDAKNLANRPGVGGEKVNGMGGVMERRKIQYTTCIKDTVYNMHY